MATPNTGIPYVPENTTDPAAGLNLALNVIDALLQTAVISMTQTAPPGSPADGDLYIVGAAATGAWAGQDNNLARYVAEGNFWQFYAAGTNVHLILNKADFALYAWNGASWVPTTDSSAAWGGITGTLSDQTDLQEALNAKLDDSQASAFGLDLLDDADAAAARTTLGLGTAATQPSTDFATAEQGALADSAVQPGDAVSELTNDAGYVNSLAAAAAAPVQSVFGRTGAVAPAAGDYTFEQIGSTPTTLGGYGIADATPSSHVGSGGDAHAAASPTEAGFMAAADKAKLDGVAAGATANVGTVTSVAVANATGISWTGSPITTSGTLIPTLAANLQAWSGIATSDKLDSSSYTASDVLAKLKTVDGAGSGIDADLLDGLNSTQLVRNDANGEINGQLSVLGGLKTDKYVNSTGRVLSYDFSVDFSASVGNGDTYLNAGEVVELFSFKPTGSNHNYYVEGVVKLQESQNSETLFIRCTVRSNTLPSMAVSGQCERFSETGLVFATPEFWINTTSVGEVRLVIVGVTTTMDVECSFKVFQRLNYGDALSVLSRHAVNTLPTNFVRQSIPIRTELGNFGFRVDGYGVYHAGNFNPATGFASATVTASRTLALTDAGKLLNADHATTAILLTVPPTSSVAILKDTEIQVRQAGAAAVTISPGAGVSIQKPATRTNTLAEQYSVVTMKKGDGDAWALFGDLGIAP